MDDATASDNCSDVSITESETIAGDARQLHDCSHVHCDGRVATASASQTITVEDTTLLSEHQWTTPPSALTS